MKRFKFVEILEKTFTFDDDLKFEIGKLFGEPLLIIKNQKGQCECFGIDYQKPKLYKLTCKEEIYIGSKDAIKKITNKSDFQEAIKSLELKGFKVEECQEDIIKFLNTDRIVAIRK